MVTKLMAGMVLAACGLAACAGAELSVSEGVAQVGGSGGGGDYDIEPQGHWLLGPNLDVAPFVGVDYHFSVDHATRKGVPVTLEVTGHAALSSGAHVGADKWFGGVIVANERIELQLAEPTGDADIAHYKLLRRDASGAFTIDVCDGGSATPLAGVFNLEGLHIPLPGRITFACDVGVGDKCARWGYGATATPGLAWDAHQACTRMARADYWSNGISHTRMETSIKIADSIPGLNDLPTNGMFGDVTVWPPDPANYYFEAAWWPGTHKAGCLSKLRWASLPIGGLGDGVPDPRRDPDAKNCEDMVVGDLVTAGALTFVGTAYNDLPLQIWSADTAGGPDFVTTVRGYRAELEDRMLRPFSDFHVYHYEDDIGFLLRKIPGSITDPNDIIEVFQFNELANNRMVLAPANDPRFRTGYTRAPEREGWVFSWQRPGTVAFRLYKNATTGDYVSSVDDAVPAGYTWAGNIGWILPRE